jgi:hypothetical protein
MEIEEILIQIDKMMTQISGLLDSGLLPGDIWSRLGDRLSDFKVKMDRAVREENLQIVFITAVDLLNWFNEDDELHEWFVGEQAATVIKEARNFGPLDPNQTWNDKDLSQIVPKVLNHIVIIQRQIEDENNLKEMDEKDKKGKNDASNSS